ncbi:3-methyladenine DNA glycosylase [Thioclava sp. SK-1]|nr:DNA-3-methyladenine glycosylase [Thioclava sp. SK-1]OCX62333.1 3-methyladenine DNA glycosylase [Thioclava sp. SK-1]
MTVQMIQNEADVALGTEWLCRVEPRFANISSLTGPWPLRRREDGFDALRDAILGQQVSVAAATAIRGKLIAAGLAQRNSIAATTPEALRACGVSRPKARYLLALAQSDVNFFALRDLPDAEVYAQLLPIPGIGRWTVEMYLMFALGRADVFAVDDLALAEAARLVFDLKNRPRPREFLQMALPWSPWRSVAARGLWAFYAYHKKREGVAP